MVNSFFMSCSMHHRPWPIIGIQHMSNLNTTAVVSFILFEWICAMFYITCICYMLLKQIYSDHLNHIMFLETFFTIFYLSIWMHFWALLLSLRLFVTLYIHLTIEWYVCLVSFNKIVLIVDKHKAITIVGLDKKELTM